MDDEDKSGDLFIVNGKQLYFRGKKPVNDDEAFYLSKAKWRYLRDNPSVVHNGGALSCGLCQLHRDNDCRKCPVYELDKSHLHCRGTQYENFNYADTDEERRTYADAELKFLKQVEKQWRRRGWANKSE